jgi:hypothetical protein
MTLVGKLLLVLPGVIRVDRRQQVVGTAIYDIVPT